MPNTRSAKKALRQSQGRRLKNRAERSALRTLVKKVRSAAESGDQTAAGDAYRAATRQLDKAAAKHLIHKNKASRLKSRLSHLIQSKTQAQTASAPSATASEASEAE